MRAANETELGSCPDPTRGSGATAGARELHNLESIFRACAAKSIFTLYFGVYITLKRSCHKQSSVEMP